jgi:hypothetical protein
MWAMLRPSAVPVDPYPSIMYRLRQVSKKPDEVRVLGVE